MGKRVLAFDFGASSGRAMLGTLVDGEIQIEEIHRFVNEPVIVHKTMYWDTLRLFHEIKQGIRKAKLRGGFDSIGIDTWGVDFGLLDRDGNLLENSIHYRDPRTKGMMEESFRYLDKDTFYQITGNQFMELNTVFQLLSIKQNRPELLERADAMLLTPDLFGYFLTGKKYSEYSIASTTQLLDAKTKTWSETVMDKLGLPKKLLQPIVSCPTIVGTLQEDICEELGVEPAIVVAIASHDTQSAMVSVPATEEDFVFLSCGTWSLLGTELDAPIINEESNRLNVTNEGGCEGKTSFLKNIIGLWLIQESRRQWILEGKEYSFGELEQLSKEAKPLQCFIDPDAEEFGPAGDIPSRIKEYCRRSNQYVPQSIGEIVRCINESLAMKYRYSMKQLRNCTGKEYHKLYMVGGGIQSKLLCQMTADSCGLQVSAGPVEATIIGNVAQQLMALGEFDSLQEIREVIASSPEVLIYEPKDHDLWNEGYERFLRLICDEMQGYCIK